MRKVELRAPLTLHLQQIDSLDATIAGIDAEVDVNVEPFRAAIRLLTTIPGVSDLAARSILAGIGTDMLMSPLIFFKWVRRHG